MTTQDIDRIIANLSRLDTQAWLMIVLALAIVCAFAWLLWTRQRNRGRVVRVLRSLAGDFRRDLVIPDGIGGQIQLEYLLLTMKGLVVLDVKNYRGTLFGAEHIPTWSQLVPAGSYKFTNPLPQNALRVQAVKLLVGDVPVCGRVVFTQEGYFPKGLPAGVSLLEGLAQDLGLAAQVEGIPDAYRDGWHYLLSRAEQPDPGLPVTRQSV